MWDSSRRQLNPRYSPFVILGGIGAIAFTFGFNTWADDGANDLQLLSWVGYFIGPFMILLGTTPLVTEAIRRRHRTNPPPSDIFGPPTPTHPGPWSSPQPPTTPPPDPH